MHQLTLGVLLFILLISVHLFVIAVPTKKKMPVKVTKKLNVAKSTSKAKAKPDYRFTTGFYYPIDTAIALSFPYPESELWFKFNAKNSIVKVKDSKGKTWKNIKQFIKIPASSVVPGVYKVEFLVNSTVMHKKSQTVQFFGCNYNSIRQCHKKVANNDSISPGESVCVSDLKGRYGSIREVLKVDMCRKYSLLNADRAKRRICLSDGTAVKTMCEAYFLYNMTNRVIFETLNSTKCTPYQNMNLSFGWNFYDCDKASDVPIYHDSYYEPEHDGPLKICIYCGTQWKGYKFSIQFLPQPNGQRLKLSLAQANFIGTGLKKACAQESLTKSRSKAEPAPRLIAKPSCNPSKNIKTTSLRCLWKDTVAGQYPSARVDVQYMFSNGTVLQNNDELLEIYVPGSYMCQVKVYPSVCPIYDDVTRTNHVLQNSKVLNVTSACVENLGKSPPQSLKSSFTTSTSFILVIVFSSVIVVTGLVIASFYVARGAIQSR
uniref:Uncharacterized protein n=1 Tax=Romanomermis culicivorax TaxID=13658 RepID=A0A915HKN9_ROMCU